MSSPPRTRTGQNTLVSTTNAGNGFPRESPFPCLLFWRQFERIRCRRIPALALSQSIFASWTLLTRSTIFRFTGSAGTAVVSKSAAYLIADSRYWLQAQEQLDSNWHLVQAGGIDGPKDWVEWLSDRANESRIGIDARMIAHEKAVILNNLINTKKSKLVYPPQNLVDLIWSDKPLRPKEPIFVQPLKYAGLEASAKLSHVRAWIKEQKPSMSSYTKTEAKPSQVQVATLITSLSSIGMFFPRGSLRDG